jgi:predicted O-methyltransferase YrrM
MRAAMTPSKASTIQFPGATVGKMRLSQRAAKVFSLGRFLAETALHNGSYDPESAVDLAFGCESIRPVQIRSELIELARVVQGLRPRTMLEIGSATGGTLFVLCQMADPQATVVSIDLPGAAFGGGYGAYRIPIMRRLKQQRQKLHLMRTNSHSPETSLRLQGILQNATIQFLFIDGDHSYEGVKQDFKMYSPLVAPGGIIGFHDIVKAPAAAGGEVNIFWNEIKPAYRHREIIADSNQATCGIGLLFL